MLRVLILTTVLIALLASAGSAIAGELPFKAVFSQDVNGSIVIAANGAVQCDAVNTQCALALFREGKKLNNNDWNMQYIDVDAEPSSFSSSASDLAVPTGAHVLWAGLYWGGYSASAARERVGFREGNGTYESVNSTQLGTYGASGQAYGAFADVTKYVREHGAGTYWVSNITTNVGNADVHAGWSLVVAYADPADPPRNLTVFDGYLAVESGKASVTADVNGFLTPRVGPVRTAVGAVAWEGDVNLTGDQMLLNGKALSNNANPATNAFNSTISTFGEYVNSRMPAYTNLFGVDADLFGADATYLPNGSTSAKVQVTTNGDRILLSTLTFATELFAPNLEVRKTVEDLNGGDVMAGDRLRYTITTQNTGADSATSVVLRDPVPDHTTYVDGSAEATNGFASEDAGVVLGYLGAGSTAASGGTLAPGASAVVTFDVVVADGVASGTAIPNEVTVAGTAATLGKTLRTYSNTRVVTVGDPGSSTEGGPDGEKSPEPVINEGTTPTGATATTTSIGVSIAPSRKRPRVGNRYTYFVQTVNTADGIDALDVATCVPIPAKVAVVNAYGGTVANGRVCWSTPRITSGATRGYRLQVRVNGNAHGATILANARATASNADPARSRARVDVPRGGVAPAPVPSPVTG